MQAEEEVAKAIEAPFDKLKKQNHHVYDDETVENMIKYYGLHENYDSLLRFIKSNGIKEDDQQLL